MAIFQSGMSKKRYHDIFNKAIGTIIPIPSESSGVIVNWERDDLRITSILSPTTRKCLAFWTKKNRGYPAKEFELETPALILSGQYGVRLGSGPPIPCGDNPSALGFRRGSYMNHNVAIAMLDTDTQDKIMVKPYRLANVYDGSNICFGSNSPPKTLREANNLFWSAPFNCDFGGPLHGAQCKNIEHHNQNHNMPQSVHRQQRFGVCSCGDKHRVENSSLCHHCGGILPDLLSDELKERVKSVGTLNICTLGLCTEHQCKCHCDCCQLRCGCRCRCDLTDDFIKGLQAYASPDAHEGDHWGDFCPLSRLSWEDWTRTICGSKYNRLKPKFLSYTGRADGVFISYDESFIKNHPKEIVRNHGGHRCVIGLYRMTPRGYEIDFGKSKELVSSRKVIQIYDKWESQQQREERERREYRENQEAERARRDRERADRLAQTRRTRELQSEIAGLIDRRLRGSNLESDEQASMIYRSYFTGPSRFDRMEEIINEANRPITSPW